MCLLTINSSSERALLITQIKTRPKGSFGTTTLIKLEAIYDVREKDWP
jgi:hypothetical protein